LELTSEERMMKSNPNHATKRTPHIFETIWRWKPWQESCDDREEIEEKEMGRERGDVLRDQREWIFEMS
jgi:hypothetical protein